MKKSAFVIIILGLCLSLFSCGADKERFFDYQDSIRTVSGVYTFGEEEYGVTLYFEKTDAGRRCRRIEYDSPESLSGISYTIEGDKITAELDGIRIAYSYFEEESIFRASRLFDLCEEDIYDIKSGKDKTTISYGKNEDSKWEVVTSKEGKPIKITYENKEILSIFKVKKIELFEDESK